MFAKNFAFRFRDHILILGLPLVFILKLASAQQSYCWEPCSYYCPSAAPRLCPPEGILIYYDCCFGQECCQYIKWPNLIFLIIIIIMLLSGCACCFCFLFTDARQRMFAKQQQTRQQQQPDSDGPPTARSASPYPAGQGDEPRASLHSPHYQLSSVVHNSESTRSKSRSSSTPTSAGIIYHKQSTVV